MKEKLDIFKIIIICSIILITVLATAFTLVVIYPLDNEANDNIKVLPITNEKQNETNTILTNGQLSQQNIPIIEPEIITLPSIHTGNKTYGDLSEHFVMDEATLSEKVATKDTDSSVLSGSNIIISGTNATDVSSLGDELTNDEGWISNGWTGDYLNGFTHIPGNNNPLSRPIDGIEKGKRYQVVYTLSGRTENDLKFYDTPLLTAVTIGGYTYDPWAGDSYPLFMKSDPTFKRGVTAIESGEFSITPASNFSGTISSISIREIISTVEATFVAYDSVGKTSSERRQTLASLCNEFSGYHAGMNVSSASYSAAFGYNAMANTTSGDKNTAFGYGSLFTNTIGEANAAFGAFALGRNVEGSVNTAIGVHALGHNTSGERNTAVGHNALYWNTTGYRNVAVGEGAMSENLTGYYNTAIGWCAMTSSTGSLNTSVGTCTLLNNTGDSNNAFGASTLESNTTGNNNCAFGSSALRNNTTGKNNSAFGQVALFSNTNGENNSAFGRKALWRNTTGKYNCAFGEDALHANIDGSSNVAIGFQAGFYETGSNHLWIDNSARGDLNDAQKKALIYGKFDNSTDNQMLTFNAQTIFMHYIPTYDPIEKGQLWNNNGVLCISNGMLKIP